jgi:hypothetical protein
MGDAAGAASNGHELGAQPAALARLDRHRV